jgi:hypothetical protein
LGWSKWEWFWPVNPTETHNYLEQVYNQEEMQSEKFRYESGTLVKDPIYDRYYVLKKKT